MLLSDLIAGLPARLLGPLDPTVSPGPRITDITEDSRTVLPGSLFVARRGEKSDGKAFIPQALKAGAAAVLVDEPAFVMPEPHAGVPVITGPDPALLTAQVGERFYGSPSSRLAVLGVTGTNGKTTTTFLMHQILNALGIRTGLIGTVVIDDGTEVAPSSLTTPPALEVSRTLARMLDAGCRAAAMEVSSHSLHQKRVGAVRFRAGVFTNLTQDHLDYHKTMDAYAAAKAVLFEMLGPEAVAVVNVQDPWHTRMVRDCRAPIVRCIVDDAGALPVAGGTAPRTIVRARVVRREPSGSTIALSGAWGERTFRLPLIGSFNVFNALNAIATVSAVFGPEGSGAIGIDDIVGVAQRLTPPPGRMESVTGPDSPLSVFVDYAHTDDALRTVLSVVRASMDPAGRGRLWCVFGCGGDRDTTKRPKMGRVASSLSDRAVITSDNPRTEDPGAIIEMIRAGIDPEDAGKVEVEPDRERAIARAIAQAHPGDVLVIAGKGHETDQILPDPARPGATISRHFDDREVARQALRRRGIAPR
jgi:UDP-N-acetylmuramoyl-L-alanyl-D-glutamate--2,6-diaminopimelate ligase